MTICTWKDLDAISQSKAFDMGTSVTVGSFDGFHLGHRFLLEAMLEESKKNGYLPVGITFSRPLPAIKHSIQLTGCL